MILDYPTATNGVHLQTVDKPTQVGVGLDPETYAAFKKLCDENYRSIAAQTRLLIDNFIKQNQLPPQSNPLL